MHRHSQQCHGSIQKKTKYSNRDATSYVKCALFCRYVIHNYFCVNNRVAIFHKENKTSHHLGSVLISVVKMLKANFTFTENSQLVPRNIVEGMFGCNHKLLVMTPVYDVITTYPEVGVPF